MISYDYLTSTCLCLPGYQLNNDRCVDIDECREGSDKCQAGMSCINTVGSYECKSLSRCEAGYERDSLLDPCQG
ncbi:hypothetical protein Ciccas_007928 [Cichlidogyrus casuarinus]|uniref:EGF-like calcium-binding domain-containing protein n=1 Tax=Cichlidogyrus casuarinus TaxID=1844966 RepID=A0ABD2Q1H3_9PLAT